MVHQVGETVVLRIKKRYVSEWEDVPGGIVYAPESDRMKSWYDYYVFRSKEQFETAAAAAGSDEDGCLVLSVVVDAVAGRIDQLSDPNLPQPEGGFTKTFYSVSLTP